MGRVVGGECGCYRAAVSRCRAEQTVCGRLSCSAVRVHGASVSFCRQAEHYDKQSLTCGWTCLILIPAPDWHHWGVVIVRVAAYGAMVARPGARPHGDDDPTTRLRFHLYDAPLRRSCCSRCYAECRPRFRLGSGGGLYSAHNTFFHWCRTPSSSDPPRLRFVASTSSALPRLCPGASCASSNREFVLNKLCPAYWL